MAFSLAASDGPALQREHADMSAWDERRLIGRYYGASPRPPMPHDDSWEAHTAGREQRAGLVLLLVQRPLHAARANLHGTVETKNHKPGLMIPTRTPLLEGYLSVGGSGPVRASR